MSALTTTEKTRLIALESRLDAVLFGQHYDPDTGRMVDDDGSGVLGTVATAAGVGAAGYGGYKAVQAVGNKMDTLSQTVKKGGMGRAYGNLGTLGKVGTATKAVGQDVWDALKKGGAKVAARVGLESKQRLTALSAKLDKALA